MAVFTPFGMCLTLFIPLYLGMLAACYIVYYGTSPHPLATRLDDVFYIVDVYSGLFSYWQANMLSVSFFSYSLPVVVLPLLGAYVAYKLTRKFAGKMGDMFHISVGQ